MDYNRIRQLPYIPKIPVRRRRTVKIFNMLFVEQLARARPVVFSPSCANSRRTNPKEVVIRARRGWLGASGTRQEQSRQTYSPLCLRLLAWTSSAAKAIEILTWSTGPGFEARMKILVTGADGQVGWELRGTAKQKRFDVLTRSRDALDITDPISVEREVCRPGISLVVNAAAYNAVDRAELEPEIAFAVNRDGPAHLASACARAGIPLVHISTDYVFDGGKDGPYVETDPVSPLGVYGQSKASGEAEIRNLLRNHIILRTSWVYGVHGENFVKTILRLGRENESVRVVADQFGCPTYAADLAEAILSIAGKLRDTGVIEWGTYHYCGKGVTTWHGFAEEIFKLASQHTSLRVDRVEPISTADYPTHAKRPANSVLDCSLLEKTFDVHPKPWSDSLARMINLMFSVEQPKLRC